MIPPKEKYLLISDYVTKRDYLIYLMMNGDLDEITGKLNYKDVAEFTGLGQDRPYKIYNRVKEFVK
jgi:hypothetical protein